MGEKKSRTKQAFRLLGSSDAKYPERPSAKILETFDNRFSRRSYEVMFDCAEFTSMCPVTGQPPVASAGGATRLM